MALKLVDQLEKKIILVKLVAQTFWRVIQQIFWIPREYFLTLLLQRVIKTHETVSTN